MDIRNKERRYEDLYTELLGRGEQLHIGNKKRIRRGIIFLVILPFALEFIRWMTDSDKVVFLIIWVLIMFAVSAYLISIEYLDSTIEHILRDVTDSDADFDGLLPHADLHERILERLRSRRTLRDERPGTDAVKTVPAEAGSASDLSVEPAGGSASELPDQTAVYESTGQEAAQAGESALAAAAGDPDEIIAALKEAIASDSDLGDLPAAVSEGEEGAI